MDEFRGELKEQFGLPAFPLLHTASWLCRQEYGWDFREASALEQVKKCTLPMLFIHGDADTFVPTWMVYPLYEAKPEPKELWIVPGATHAMSYKDYPQEYTEHVKKFVGNTYVDVIFPTLAPTNTISMKRFISITFLLCMLSFPAGTRDLHHRKHS